MSKYLHSKVSEKILILSCKISIFAVTKIILERKHLEVNAQSHSCNIHELNFVDTY